MWNPLILLFPAAARLQSTKEKHLNTEVQEQESSAVHVDVLIVGAGISGIGSAYHLQQQCPTKSYAILEMKDTFGGTWETHKYPGVRSDSDLYTFGYRLPR